MTTKSRALANYRSANKEAQGRYVRDMDRRQRAARILNPNEVAGEYDAGRLLTTTLGGEPRSITHDDLRAFQANVRTVGKKFRRGITAKAVIDFSLPEDRARSNREIHMAVPVQTKGGRMHFITNASPKSEVLRHHVHLNLLNYDAAVASPIAPKDLVKTLASGPLQFDCDCGRHTFWFRYIATIGHFNAGRNETGYPKIRNPQLSGVACKHVLRVMQQLSSAGVQAQLVKMIEAGRNLIQARTRMISKAEAEEIMARQAEQRHWKRNQVESIGEKRLRLAGARALQAVVQRSTAKLSPAGVAASVRQLEASARRLAQAGVLTDKQLAALLSKLNK